MQKYLSDKQALESKLTKLRLQKRQHSKDVNVWLVDNSHFHRVINSPCFNCNKSFGFGDTVVSKYAHSHVRHYCPTCADNLNII